MGTTSTTNPTSSSPSSPPTAPSTPASTSSIVQATKPSSRCTSSFCPINHPHNCGLYLHSCRVAESTQARRIFAPSIPPPDVLAAYERCIRNDGTSADVETWVTFHELHVEPLLEHTDTVWIAPVPTRSRDDDLTVGERVDPGCVEVNDTADGCRHPFGLLNPPQKVWEAHKRLALGDGVSEDQELVEEFAVKNAYYGTGLGKQTSMSRRFKVRRPRYSPSLAKRRRIEKDLVVKLGMHQA